MKPIRVRATITQSLTARQLVAKMAAYYTLFGVHPAVLMYGIFKEGGLHGTTIFLQDSPAELVCVSGNRVRVTKGGREYVMWPEGFWSSDIYKIEFGTREESETDAVCRWEAR